MSTSTYDFLVEEEAQVVPSSLDHLSRHELCHMIYRLDYERHTLKEKLVALRLAVSASNEDVGGGGGGGGGGRRRTKQATQRCRRQGRKKTTCSDDEGGGEKVAKRQKTTNDHDEPIQQNQQQEEPTSLEINAIYQRLTQTLISDIKVTTHGGLLRPRTTAEEKDVSLTTAMRIMQQWFDKLTHDTKRMTKWEFTSCDDSIAKFLQCDKYLSGVRHNGKGFLIGNGLSLTQFAKFESMIVSYDKFTMMMKVEVSTRGCNEKGICC
jgi:hypothetical protein